MPSADGSSPRHSILVFAQVMIFRSFHAPTFASAAFSFQYKVWIDYLGES